MMTEDVTDTLDLALQTSGCDHATVLHKPRLLSDNGSSYISGELAEWLEDQKMDHDRGAPYHPQTRGRIDTFVDHYNHRRHHESSQNLTPTDVYFGRGQTILKKRQWIKRKTIQTRRLLHRKSAAQSDQSDEPHPLLDQSAICPKPLTMGISLTMLKGNGR